MLNKKEILVSCENSLNEKIDSISAELESIKAAYSLETKSSMGDKYETTRELLNTERSKLQSQLDDTLKMLHNFNSINYEAESDTIRTGSLFKTDKGYFLISIGLGMVNFKETKIFVISPASPLAQAAANIKTQESFKVNGVSHRVENIF